jgi:hypothetical protein
MDNKRANLDVKQHKLQLIKNDNHKYLLHISGRNQDIWI